MIRLILSDLVANARVWLGILAIAAVTGFVAALAAGMIETGAAHGGDVQGGLASTSSVVIVFTGITVLIVLSGTANLSVALQRRSYALWQLVGIRPGLIAVTVLAQLAIVGVLGSALGCLLALPVIGPLFEWSFREWPTMRGVTIGLSAPAALFVSLAVGGATVLGGLRGARSASRTPPIEALRDPEPRRTRLGWFRFVLAAGALGALLGIALSIRGGSITRVTGPAPLLTPLAAGVLGAIGPLLNPLLLRAWTAVVPARLSTSWFLARHASRARLSRSSAAIGPLMVAIALAGGLYTAGATLAAGEAARSGSARGFELAPEGVVIMLGGPLLLSAVGAAAAVFMSGHAREREVALLRAAGATNAVVRCAAAWEAVIFTVTAVILGLAATLAGGVIISAAIGLAAPTVPLASVSAVAGGGFLLLLAATLAPTAAALRTEIPRVLAAQ